MAFLDDILSEKYFKILLDTSPNDSPYKLDNFEIKILKDW